MSGPVVARSLRRALGTGLLTVLVVGDILGAGIYIFVGEVATEVGGLLWLPFLIAFSLAALTALSYVTAAVVSRAVGGQYLSVLIDVPVVPVALGTILLLSLVVWIGIAESARANAVLTIIEVTGLVLVVIAGAVRPGS